MINTMHLKIQINLVTNKHNNPIVKIKKYIIMNCQDTIKQPKKQNKLMKLK